MSDDVSVERLSVAEAAEALGVTRDAIHKRITRGTIRHEKGEDGRFYVYVDTSTEGLDPSTDKSKDESKVEVLERLVESHENRIASLERELERRGVEAERYQQIVAGLTQANTEQARTIRAIEAPAPEEESPEAAETVEEEELGEDEGVDEHDRREGEVGREEGPAIATLRERLEKDRESQSSSETPQRPQGGGLRGLRRRLLGW